MSAARIGRVKMKAGGADVRVLHTPQPPDYHDVPASFIRVGNAIAAGEHGAVRRAVTVTETDTGIIKCYGFGWTADQVADSIGMLHLGIARLCRMGIPKEHDDEGVGS